MSQTVTCYKCGAIVDAGYQSKHKRMHSDMDDLERKLQDVERIARRAGR